MNPTPFCFKIVCATQPFFVPFCRLLNTRFAHPFWFCLHYSITRPPLTTKLKMPKLAELLAERSRLSKRLNELKTRIEQNAKTDEGSDPAEKPLELLTEWRAVCDQLPKVICAINSCNNTAKLNGSGARLLCDAIAEREVLDRKIVGLSSIADAGLISHEGFRASTTKLQSHIPVAELRKEVDTLKTQRKLLESQIQSTNWTVEVDFVLGS